MKTNTKPTIGTTTTEEKIEEIYIHNVIDVRVSSGAIYKVRMIDEIMQLIEDCIEEEKKKWTK